LLQYRGQTGASPPVARDVVRNLVFGEGLRWQGPSAPGAARMAKDLCRLVYRSDSRIDHNDDAALDGIFRSSVRNNLRDRITGALALPDGKFVQVIEGRKRELDALMTRIRADERHGGVVLLGEWAIADRLFSGWAMARPDPAPLGQQAFRIVTEDGSGVQVTGILLGMTREATDWL